MCIYIYIHIYIYIYIYIYICVCVCVCVVCMCVNARTRMFYECMYVYVCKYICVCVYLYILYNTFKINLIQFINRYYEIPFRPTLLLKWLIAIISRILFFL